MATLSKTNWKKSISTVSANCKFRAINERIRRFQIDEILIHTIELLKKKEESGFLQYIDIYNQCVKEC